MASRIDIYCNSEVCRGFNCKSGIGIQLYEGKAFACLLSTKFRFTDAAAALFFGAFAQKWNGYKRERGHAKSGFSRRDRRL